ncbi:MULTISPECIES: alkene reductase [unclassified Streptomyces]|uniref:oxidoreductase n=1 Tax=unclassified Streptomyces TaxID=2593676 RepID=UPI00210D7059|nr:MULTISPECIES: alkene reductase [unclassified Streptomyces]
MGRPRCRPSITPSGPPPASSSARRPRSVRNGFGWADTPGLWSSEHVRGWRQVTEAVHATGGRMIAQLWRAGAMSHPDLREGALPLSASAVDPQQRSVTPTGRKPTVTPRVMSTVEIRQTIADYATAACNAIAAGFDGVQILANYLYLPAQFLNKATNQRTDAYGGSIANRARLSQEIADAVATAVGPERTGGKLGPMHETGPFEAHDETLPTAEYVISHLNGLSHLLVMGATRDLTATPLDNPDLPARLATGAPLADIDWSTVYASGARGYTDYPALATV